MNVKRFVFSVLFFFGVGFGFGAVSAAPPIVAAANVDAISGGGLAASGSAATVDELPRVDVAAATTATPPSATAPPPHDPLKEPIETIGDLKAARKYGWAAVVFFALWQLALIAGRLGQSVGWLAKLSQGRVAVVVGAVAALGAAGYNALALGGSLVAALFAAATAAALFKNSDASAKPKDATAS